MRVLIVDKHHVVGAGFKRLFREEADVEISVARTLEEAELINDERLPDVVVWGLGVPDRRETIEHYRKAFGLSGMLVFADENDVLSAKRAQMMGAKGFLSKASNLAEVRDAVLAVGAGAEYFHPSIVQALALIEIGRGKDLSAEQSLHFQVLDGLVGGQTLPQIAHELGISYKTATRLCAHLRRKLGAANQLDLVMKALANGLIAVVRQTDGRR